MRSAKTWLYGSVLLTGALLVGLFCWQAAVRSRPAPAPPPEPEPLTLAELLPGEWDYTVLEDLGRRSEYLLTLEAAAPAPEGEVRLLLDRTAPDTFCCLSIRPGEARFVRVANGLEAPVAGGGSVPFDASADDLRIGVFRLPDAWVVTWGGEDRFVITDPLPGEGDAALGCAGGATVANHRVQPLEDILYRDDFGRETFAPNGLYEVRAGNWSIRTGPDTGKSVNAFRATASGAEAVAVFGRPFWRHYRVSAAVLYAGDGAAGLVWGASSGERYGLVRWQRGGDGTGRLDVVARDGEDEAVLASRPWVPRTAQWYDLSVEIWGSEGVVTVSGETLPFAVPPGLRGGPCGLYAAGKEMVFDDVACISVRRTPGDSAPTLVPMLRERELFAKGTVQYKEHGIDTWRYDQSSWQAEDDAVSQNTLFWGDAAAVAEIPGLDRDGAAARLEMLAPDAAELVAALAVERREGVLRVAGEDLGEVAPQAAEGSAPAVAPRLELRRRGDAVEALLGERAVQRFSVPAGVPVRFRLQAPNAAPDRLDIRAANLADSVFEGAPVDWVRWRGTWDIASKWQCQPGWTYMSLYTEQPDTMREAAGVWTVDSYHGDQDLQFYVALKDMLGEKVGGRRYVRRDMNFSFCGDGNDPANSGYAILFGGFGNRGTQLLRRGEVVCENPDARFPPFRNTHHDVHWVWWYCRIVRHGSVITFLVDNEEILRYDDPDPLPGGHVGVWTVGNGLVVTRTRFTWEDKGDTLRPFDDPAPDPAPVCGWSPLSGGLPVAVSAVPGRPRTVRVTNREAGGRFAVVREPREGETGAEVPVYRVPEGVTVYPYAWNGTRLRRIRIPEVGNGPLLADDEWHSLVPEPGALRTDERLAIGYDGDEAYLCVGLGGNRRGAEYFLDALEPVPPPENIRVVASSTHREWPGEGPAEAVVDGDPETRWSSDYADNQELTVDLGEPVPLRGVRLLWEESAPRRYSISVSADGTGWTQVAESRDGRAGPRTDGLVFTPSRARFLRLELAERLNTWGFSLYEIQFIR